MKKDVMMFYGKKHPLSNYYETQFRIGDIIYPTVEHYFQSRRTDSFEERIEIIFADTYHEAQKLGRWVEFPVPEEEWVIKRLKYMYNGMKAKFTQNGKLKKYLIGTGDKDLIDDNPYDSYWGVGADGEGQNMNGILLMKVREELKK